MLWGINQTYKANFRVEFSAAWRSFVMDEFTQEEIAKQRNSDANQMTDSSIYSAVVENVLNLDCTIHEKVEFLFQTVPDFSILTSQLTLFKSKGLVTYEEYSNLMQKCLLMVNKRDIDSYSPLFLTKDER
jgi:hypothetical protein